MKIACAYIPSHSTSPFTTANALKESPPKKKKSSSGSGRGIPNVWDQILIHVSEWWRQVKTWMNWRLGKVRTLSTPVEL
jgi:hypothetical protein